MSTIYGDAEGTLETRAKGQTLVGIDGDTNIIYGDSYEIENRQGGNDVLNAGTLSPLNYLYGDAFELSKSRGGNDLLIGGDFSYSNYLCGDAFVMSDSQGGNDVLTGGANSTANQLHGDAAQMFDSTGGNDTLTGGANAGSRGNFLYGDAYEMFNSQGGNDVLTGDANSYSNELYGDAKEISAGQGGNDILIAHAIPSAGGFVTNNQLYGDAKYHFADNVNDDMWGDIAYSGYANEPVDLTRVTTGHDVFVFSANNGNDTIHDFRHGEDKIELQGVGVTSFDALMAGSHLSQDSTNSVITFGTNTITVVGVTELTAADFMFT